MKEDLTLIEAMKYLASSEETKTKNTNINEKRGGRTMERIASFFNDINHII